MTENGVKKEMDDLQNEIKAKLDNLIHSNTFCGVCLEVRELCFDVDEVISDNSLDYEETITLRDMLVEIFKDEVQEILFNDTICLFCKHSIMNNYTYIRKIKTTASTFKHYFNQLFGKIEESMIHFDQNTLDYHQAVIVLNHVKTENVDFDEEKNFIINEPKTYVCDNCNRSYKNRKQIVRHIKRGTCKRKYYCYDCLSNQCVHKKYLDCFRESNLGTETEFLCDLCDYVALTTKDLLVHLNKVHLNMIVGECTICVKPFYSRKDFENHMRRHKTSDKNPLKSKLECLETEFKCTECDSLFTTETELNKHTNLHTGKYVCDVCNKPSVSKIGLISHKRIHKEKHLKRLTCSICDVKFKTVQDKQTHMSTHNNLHCEPCKMYFKSLHSYRNHLKKNRHKKRLVEPYVPTKNTAKCKFCDYATCSLISLEAHINGHHLKIAPYVCEVCGKRYTGIGRLEAHMKYHQEKSHQCDKCGLYFCGSDSLKKHTLLHTGERPYKCDICGLGFTCASARSSHRVRKHTERKLPCPICKSLFHAEVHMKRHLLTVHFKGGEFDVNKIGGLGPEYRDLFRDKRRLNFVGEE